MSSYLKKLLFAFFFVCFLNLFVSAADVSNKGVEPKMLSLLPVAAQFLKDKLMSVQETLVNSSTNKTLFTNLNTLLEGVKNNSTVADFQSNFYDMIQKEISYDIMFTELVLHKMLELIKEIAMQGRNKKAVLPTVDNEASNDDEEASNDDEEGTLNDDNEDAAAAVDEHAAAAAAVDEDAAAAAAVDEDAAAAAAVDEDKEAKAKNDEKKIQNVAETAMTFSSKKSSESTLNKNTNLRLR